MGAKRGEHLVSCCCVTARNMYVSLLHFRAVSTEFFFHFVFTADEDTLKVSLQFCTKWAGVG